MINDLSNIFNRIDNQIKNTTQFGDICLAGAVRQLCEARDSGFVQFVDRNQIVHFFPFCNYFSFTVLLYAYYVVLFHVCNKDNNNNSLHIIYQHVYNNFMLEHKYRYVI